MANSNNSYINQINNTAFSINQSASSISQFLNLGSLLSDLNNIAEVADVTDTGWVGSDPLYSHFYIMQPALYQGTYIPRNFVKTVKLPTRTLTPSYIPFRGGQIYHYKGYSVGSLSLTFYENQEFQILSYLRKWQAGCVGVGGTSYGLPNDYKYTMYFINNNSLGQPFNTITSNIINKLPASTQTALNKIEFCGLMIMFGCSVKNIQLPTSELRKFDTYEITAEFLVDEIVQIPLSADIGAILEILGLQTNNNNDISKYVSKALNPFS